MTHAEIINLWPSLTAFAEDIGAPYGTAKAMRRRSSVPPGYWGRMVEHADLRGIVGVTPIRLLAGVPVPERKPLGVVSAEAQP